jgi:hypothetical protein
VKKFRHNAWNWIHATALPVEGGAGQVPWVFRGYSVRIQLQRAVGNQDMSRYFFNLAGEPPVDDPEGAELPDLATAREHAIAVAHALMRRTKIFRHDQARWAVHVTDHDGNEVLAVPFREASALAVDDRRSDLAAFEGRLGWKVQLHIGRQMAAAYDDALDRKLPDHLGTLLERLAEEGNSQDN